MYSFGIILQEIALRNGPFYVEGMDLSPKGKHERLYEPRGARLASEASDDLKTNAKDKGTPNLQERELVQNIYSCNIIQAALLPPRQH